jgi:ABC-type nitrate/sulfonate/bicarbonate transport system substrate-binding protein
MRSWRTLTAVVATALVAAGCGSSASGNVGSGGSKGKIVVASPQCAHCLAMSLLPGQIPGYDVTFQPFTKVTDLTAGLASGRIDVGQIDYTGLVSLIDQGFPVVAISGEVNGGSDFIVSPQLKVKAGDWQGFKSLVDQRKAAGHKIQIASQFGSVQDIELRLELPKHGIDPDNDVTMINVPYEGMAQALQRGSVDAAIPVQPFAASIIEQKFGTHFAFPYDQAAGSLTNVVVVSKSYLAKNPEKVAAIATGMNKLLPYLKTPAGQKAWADAVSKYTNVGKSSVNTALKQLTPDATMPFAQVEAIASAMYDRKLIPSKVTAQQIQDHIDYDPLAKASGRTTKALGAAQ